MNCRVCDCPIGEVALSLPAPGLTSLTTPLDAPTEVAICEACGHCQSPDPTALEAFYDNEYKISLQSDDFDQLHGMENGQPVFRTDRQVQVLLGLVDLAHGARVLDYGAAKAQSTRALLAKRPDLQPYVFDVSDDYRLHWQGWLPEGHGATYQLPAEWQGRFDLITTYFVLEHVAEPTEHLQQLRNLLAPGGRLFLIVPDSLANIGDVLIVDHVNHFSRSSLRRACMLAGLRVDHFDDTTFTGGLALSAYADPEARGPEADEIGAAVSGFKRACEHWRQTRAVLRGQVATRAGAPLALHGAGFYGSFVLQQVGADADIPVVLDANPHLQGDTFSGKTVIAPSQLPDEIKTVIVALNPGIARRVVGDGSLYGRRGLDLIFLDAESMPRIP